MNPKKFLALLLALLLLLPAFSLAEDALVCQPGDTVELTFTVTANPNLAVGAMLKLDYDHSVFELIPSSSVQNDAPIISLNMKGIPVGETVEASFLVLPNAPGGEYEITIAVEQAGDVNENNVDGFAFSSCLVSVDGAQDDLAAENEALRKQLEALMAENEALQKELENERASSRSEVFLYTVEGGAATITRYTGNGGNVAIPDALDGCPVAAIGTQAFYACQSLKSVIIPNGCASIGGFAFAGCTSLESVIIPESVASIGFNAFQDCGDALEITVVDNAYAEYYCIYNSLRYSSPSASQPAPETDFSYVVENEQAIITAYTGPGGDVIIPDTLGGYSVGSIWQRVFYNNPSLTGVTIPDGVTAIGSAAFTGCESLKSVTLPESLKSIGFGAFSGCGSLTRLHIPEGVSTIGQNAFSGCDRLVILSAEGSCAQRYCEQNNLTFQAE